MEGQQLSHYTIVSKIGEGGMGAVYRAIDSRLNRTVAIKVLPPAAGADPDRQRRFVQEAQSASALNHPNIVHIYDIDTAGEVTFIAMEFVDGRPLDALIDESPVPMPLALEYAIQAAGALAAAHQAGIIHRDVKPGNILVNRSGQVKVLDFGLAKLLRSPASETFAPTRIGTPMTSAGVVVGTPAYMAPEQADGQLVDARADVFAFGAVLYELLSGRRPFQGSSPMSVMAAVLRDRPAPLSQVCPGIPSRLEAIVMRCLEKEPAKRYPSAVELRQALEEFRASLSTPVALPTGRVTRPVIAGARRRRRAGGRRSNMALPPRVARPLGAPGGDASDRSARRRQSGRRRIPSSVAGAADHPRRSAARAADQRCDGSARARDDASGR